MTTVHAFQESTVPPPPGACQVVGDVELALRLAVLRPTGEADALRGRLRDHILTYADAAEAYARGLADGRARDIACHTVAHARAVASDPVHDPAANLRLLAKGAEMLARYAAAHQGARS
ncbi:hypothetical protein [Streptomyces sp. TRM64462]|uniref:hypothetical protein n=1 Tax=Streptomyces sp. TRM64462 TaxID=2741726 RepID=UPI001586B4E7|nr:hypothetical protein [Streptomyces sp. TRM64462]